MIALPEVPHTSTCLVDSFESLNAIRLPEYSLALWRRAPLLDIDLELAALTAGAFRDGRVRVHAGKAGDALSALFGEQGYDADTAFPGWLADMTNLCEGFFELTDGRAVTARLESLDRTACPRFHVDHSCLRLVCTYRGPGTEWLDDACVDREARRNGAQRGGCTRYCARTHGKVLGGNHEGQPVPRPGRFRSRASFARYRTGQGRTDSVLSGLLNFRETVRENRK